jgi:hypothetical protein
MLWSAMGRAKKSGVPFDLEVSDITIPELCPALGIPLFQSGKKGPCPNSPSLDRIRSELGYVKGNVVVLSHRANVIKQNASFSELQRIADWVKSVSGPCQKPETVLY